MRPSIPSAALAVTLLATGCGGASDPTPGGETPVTTLEAGDAPSPSDAGSGDATPLPDGSQLDASHPGDARAHEAGDATSACKKEITVLFSVGVGAGALAGHSNGCWTVVDADGAANGSFRKCSTSNFRVTNPNASNYAFDDTNPTAPLTQDQDFLRQCSMGATGDGYEYMAYRGSWRILPAPTLRAYFAELYGDQQDDVDSLWKASGVYEGNAQLAAHGNVYPMINIGPSPSAHLEGQIEADALALCKTIPSHGYFGTYVATWQLGMSANDARVLALAKALDACTTK